MATLRDLADSRGVTTLNFNPLKIKIMPGLNARDLDIPENREHIDFLKESIRENGYQQSRPLEVFSVGDETYVADGHCRLTAVQELIEEGMEIATVPCIPEGKGVNDVDRILRQNVSNSGKRLTMIEEAFNVKRAINLGWTQPAIAKRISKSLSYVAQLLDFAAAPTEVHTLVKQGAVSSTFAAETMREHPEDGAAILNDAVATARAEGKDKATKKHSILHQPKGKAAEGSPPAPKAPAPAQTKVSREEIKLVLSLCRDALLLTGDKEDEKLAERADNTLKAMG